MVTARQPNVLRSWPSPPSLPVSRTRVSVDSINNIIKQQATRSQNALRAPHSQRHVPARQHAPRSPPFSTLILSEQMSDSLYIFLSNIT